MIEVFFIHKRGPGPRVQNPKVRGVLEWVPPDGSQVFNTMQKLADRIRTVCMIPH